MFKGDSITRTLIDDIKDLNLPDIYTGNLQKTVHENRLLWEVWIESAESFSEFHDNLYKRGYFNIPYRCSPLYQVRPNKIVKTMAEGQPIIPIIRNMKPKSVMVQRASG